MPLTPIESQAYATMPLFRDRVQSALVRKATQIARASATEFIPEFEHPDYDRRLRYAQLVLQSSGAYVALWAEVVANWETAGDSPATNDPVRVAGDAALEWVVNDRWQMFTDMFIPATP